MADVVDEALQYVCPECGRAFSRPQALGRHRTVHGVLGRTQLPKKKPNRPRGRPAGKASDRVATTRQRSMKNGTEIPPESIGYAAGRVEAWLIDYAGRLGVPANELTTRVATVLLTASGG